jgi:hypothetical protein
MCFTKEVSFAAWLVSIIIAACIYLKDTSSSINRWLAAFIVAFSTMQLLEAGVWISIENGNGKWNEIFTVLIFLSLLVQPLIQTYFGYIATKNIVLQILTWACVGLLIWGIYKAFTNRYQSQVGPNGHLIWYRLVGQGKAVTDFKQEPLLMSPYYIVIILYMLGLFVPLLFLGSAGIPLLLIGLGTLAFSCYMYYETGEVSSIWCFSAILYSIAAFFLV